MRAAVINVVAGKSREFELTTTNHQAYALQCNADYVVAHVDKPEVSTYCHWKYAAAEIASRYDISLYLDNDCIVTRKCPDFRTATPSNHWGLVDELYTLRKWNRECLEKVAMRIPALLPWQGNAGVMIMPPDASQVYHREDWLEPDWTTDQLLLSWRLERGEAPYRLIDRRWNWSFMRPDFLLHKHQAFVIHHAGRAFYEDYDRKCLAIESDVEEYGL